MSDQTDSDSEYDFAPREDPVPEARAPERKAEKEEEAPAQRPARIEPDRVCPHCGFEIFGTPRGGRCPECAAPLDLTATDLLQFADAGWIATLSNGTMLLALGIVLDVGATVTGRGGLPRVGLLGHVVAAGVGALGIRMMTTREPGKAEEISAVGMPARWVSMAIVGAWVVALLMALLGKEGGVKAMSIAALVGYAIEAVVVGFHLQTLAARIPSDGLGAQAVNVGWLMGGFCLVLIPAQAFDIGVQQTMYIFVCAFPMGGIAIIVAVWAIVVLIRLGMDLRSAVAAGEAIAIRKAERLAKRK